MKRAVQLLFFASVVALVGCGDDPPDDPPIEAQPFDVEVGVWSFADETFTPLAAGARVPLVEGYQGLVFANLALRAERDIPARFRASGEIVFDDLDERFPFNDPGVLFVPHGDIRVAESFRVVFTPLLPSEVTGRTARVSFTLRSQDETWSSEVDFAFEIYDGNCVHNPDLSVTCDDPGT